MNIGRSTKVALAQRDKKTAWLCEQLGVSRQQAHGITVRASASASTIERLAKAFNLKPSEFVALGEDEPERSGA